MVRQTPYTQTLAPIIFWTVILRTIKTIVISLLACSAWGQTPITSEAVVSDTVNNSPNKDFETKIDIEPINLIESDFEIRFYKLTAVRNIRNLKIVRLLNGEWQALEFEEKAKSRIQRYGLIATQGFDTFLTNLTKEHFTTLPNQSEVDKRIQDSFSSQKEYWQSRPSIMDGYQFTVEFKIDNKFRVYQFSNPDSKLVVNFKFNSKLITVHYARLSIYC